MLSFCSRKIINFITCDCVCACALYLFPLRASESIRKLSRQFRVALWHAPLKMLATEKH